MTPPRPLPLVARFHEFGIDALPLRQAVADRSTRPTPAPASSARCNGGPPPEGDGTATWSLNLLKKALRAAPDGLPAVSTFTIGWTLHEAGYAYQGNRTWCHTGTVLRKRKAGIVSVTDPDTQPKKS